MMGNTLKKMKHGGMSNSNNQSASNSIEIVTHCYSGHLIQYKAFLALQLESLCRLKHQPKRVVYYSLVTHTRDVEIISTAMLFSKRLERAGVVLKVLTLDKPHLHRRAIGRNIVALSTVADVVWFCDVDYFFGPGCIKSVLNTVPKTSKLWTPKFYLCQNEHTDGDRLVEKINDSISGMNDDAVLSKWQPDEAEFYARENTAAIGGLQIVGGDFARSVGYLRGTKWNRPRHKDIELGVQRTRDDVHFRWHNKLRKTRFIIHNLFRFRHTDAGRDVLDDSVE